MIGRADKKIFVDLFQQCFQFAITHNRVTARLIEQVDLIFHSEYDGMLFVDGMLVFQIKETIQPVCNTGQPGM